MLTKEIFSVPLNRKIINLSAEKYASKENEFIDTTSNLEDYIIPFTEEELNLPREAQLRAAEKYSKQIYTQFISLYRQQTTQV